MNPVAGGGKEPEAAVLARKLEGYVLNLREVEAALEIEPAHTDLIRLKADLNELIGITRRLLSEKVNSNGAKKTAYSTGGGSSSSAAARPTRGGLLSEPSYSSGVLGRNSTPGPSRFTGDVVAGTSGSRILPAAVLSNMKTLTDDQYRDFIIQAFDDSRDPETLRHITKYYTNHGRKAMKRQLVQKFGKHKLDQEDSEEENDSGEGGHCNGTAGPAAKKECTSAAGNVPLVYRGDVLSTDDVLYLTVRQIRLKPTIYSDHKMVAAVVCLVTSKRTLAFWGVVNWKREDICQTFENTTGVTPEKLQKGLPFSQIMTLVIMAIEGKTLIGYKLEEGLQALSISHDRKEDIAEYFRDEKGPFALEDLKEALEIGHVGVGNDEFGMNNTVREVRTIRGLHAWMKSNQTAYPTFAESPYAGVLQKKRNNAGPKLKNDPNEACRCTL